MHTRRSCCLLVLTSLLVACSPGGKPAKPPSATEVTTSLSEQRQIAIRHHAEGRLRAAEQVEVRPQSSAIVQQIHFTAGSEVRKGQLLFTLDAADTSASQQKAQAEQRQIQAQLTQARQDLRRSEELAAKQFISPSAVDAARSKVNTLQAQLASAQAGSALVSTQQAQRQIRAPISGKTGVISVQTGSLAQPSSAQALVSIQNLDSLELEFSLTEAALPAIRSAQDQGSLKLDARIGSQQLPAMLSFIDNHIDPATGSILLRAQLDNRSRQLWPGQFLTLAVEAGQESAVTVPAGSVQEGPQGQFVFVLDAQSRVKATPVKLLRVQDGIALVDGLKPGLKVVLHGGQNLRDGEQVREAKAGRGGAR